MHCEYEVKKAVRATYVAQKPRRGMRMAKSVQVEAIPPTDPRITETASEGVVIISFGTRLTPELMGKERTVAKVPVPHRYTPHLLGRRRRLLIEGSNLSPTTALMLYYALREVLEKSGVLDQE